ncbi:MarR family winged helix-turn-helix transcriptional regulator [Achromobacter sp. Bel]|uniref:MarR family winged helix-turn-helix transcriptional regulator n=1 Tax=Achromobacter sp. Bel TaxID=2727415 RepID=UPI00145D06E5|nr:MarR family winged helix-turn-helix transcriptional regulator [Achromobacter sp. Bel]NMK46294.1 winged helix-turn-helix transcriptional regulator [Achromobacter sp. Bel]
MRPSVIETSQWQDPLDLLEQSGSLPVDLFLTFRVNQLSSAFERQWSRYMRDKAGVSLSEWRIMAMLQSGAQTFARIVELTEVNKALVHRSAKSLSESGLVEITDTPGDARSTTMALTRKGQTLIGKIRPLALARQNHFLSVLTAQERRLFYVAMEKLRTAAHEWDLSLKE